MFIDICHFRHQVWRLIIEICICSSSRWKKSFPVLQNPKSSAYLDSVQAFQVLVQFFFRFMSAVKTNKIKGLRRDIWETPVYHQWYKPSHWLTKFLQNLSVRKQEKTERRLLVIPVFCNLYNVASLRIKSTLQICKNCNAIFAVWNPFIHLFYQRRQSL